MMHSFTHACHSRFTLLFVDQAIGITVDETSDSATKFAHLDLQTCILIGGLLRMQPRSIFLLQALWMFQQAADLLPDHHIGLVHPKLFVPTDAFKSLPWNIHCASTTILRIALIIGSTTIRLSTLSTYKQTLQEGARAFL